MGPIRLSVVGDHRMLTDALAHRLVHEHGDFQVRCSRSTDADLGDALRGHRPAVTLVDIRSITEPWTSLVDEVVATVPLTRVVVLSDADDPEDAVIAARRCLAGWLLPDTRADALVTTLRAVADGHTVFPPRMLGHVFRCLARDLADRPVAIGPLTELTGRERAVLECLVDGRPDRETAVQLRMATNTVRTHTGRILRKLGVHSRLEAVRVAREHRAALAAPGSSHTGR